MFRVSLGGMSEEAAAIGRMSMDSAACGELLNEHACFDLGRRVSSQLQSAIDELGADKLSARREDDSETQIIDDDEESCASSSLSEWWSGRVDESSAPTASLTLPTTSRSRLGTNSVRFATSDSTHDLTLIVDVSLFERDASSEGSKGSFSDS